MLIVTIEAIPWDKNTEYGTSKRALSFRMRRRFLNNMAKCPKRFIGRQMFSIRRCNFISSASSLGPPQSWLAVRFAGRLCGLGERPGPAAVLVDDLVDLGHEADGFGEGDDDFLVMGLSSLGDSNRCRAVSSPPRRESSIFAQSGTLLNPVNLLGSADPGDGTLQMLLSYSTK